MSAEILRRSRTHAEPADDTSEDGPGAEPRRLLSLKATGRVLGGITEPQIRKLIREDHLVMVKIGRRSFVTMRSIDLYTEHLTREAAEAGSMAAVA
jgi:hypothetical protein